MKDLVIKVTGAVQESNLVEWKDSALKFIGEINTDLVTEEHFSKAVSDIEKCKETEDVLEQLKADIVDQTVEISNAIRTIDEIKVEFGKKRETLTSLKKAEDKRKKQLKEKEKQDVVDNGYNDLSALYSGSSVAFTLGKPSKSIITDAVKGKSKIENMKSAVEVVVEEEKERISLIESNHTANLKSITDTEIISLFPDRMDLALKPVGEVNAVIDKRVAEHKLEQQAKEEQAKKIFEEENAKKLAEAEKVAAEKKLEVLEESKPDQETVEEVKPIEQKEVVNNPPNNNFPPPPIDSLPSDLPEPPPVEVEQKNSYVIDLTINNVTKSDVISFGKSLREKIHVSNVTITRV